MMTEDDMTLVRAFATGQSEPAFAALVERHIALVHSAALRQAGDAHLAKDITQSVFIVLARKAAALGPKTILSAWLYRTTRYTAADALKARRRRHTREQEAFMQSTLNQSDRQDWVQLAPLLDNALAELGETDRTALVLRYFENKSAREIAAALRLEEATAQKRVARALEKLRIIFGKHGVVLTTTAIASAVAANAVQAAPVGLTMAVKAASLTAAGTGTFNFLQFMNLIKLKLGIGALVVAGTATAFVVQHQAQIKLRGENESLQQQMTQLQTDNDSLSNRLLTAAPAAMPADQQLELVKLRGEVGGLRRQAGELAGLRAENQRLQSALQNQSAQQATADTQEQQQRAAAMVKISNAKHGVLAFIMFAQDNQLQYPTNFSQAATYLKDDLREQIETNFDITYQGPTTGITNPSQTIVLMEKQPWQGINGKWMKAYGFADGHAEVHSEPNGDFANWENQRLVLPPQNQ